MKTLLGASVALVLLAGTAHGMGSKPSGYTGDKGFDSTLEKISFEANEDPDGYFSRLSSRHNIPEHEIRHASEAFGLDMPDIFMATALAKATQRPVFTVAERYKKNPGKGWGVVAKDLGIKPGSREFHELKSGAEWFLDDMNATATAKQKHEQATKQEPDHKTKTASQGKGHGKP
jgi:hypothetical protein